MLFNNIWFPNTNSITICSGYQMRTLTILRFIILVILVVCIILIKPITIFTFLHFHVVSPECWLVQDIGLEKAIPFVDISV